MAFMTDTSLVRGSFAERLHVWIADYKEAAAKRAVYRKTVQELNALSGRELADLGLSRSMIRSVAYEAAYK